jgi:hypothetical protein
MSTPQFPAAVFKDTVQALAGPYVPVAWDNEPMPVDVFSGLDANGVPLVGVTQASTVADAGLPCSIELAITSATGLGVDEYRRLYHAESVPAAGDDYQDVTVVGHRALTVTMKVISDVLPIALDVAERIRTRVYWPSSLNRLRAGGLTVRQVGQARTIPGPNRDNRVVDYVIVEYFLYFVSSETDPLGETEEVTGYPTTKNNYIAAVTTTFTKVP